MVNNNPECGLNVNSDTTWFSKVPNWLWTCAITIGCIIIYVCHGISFCNFGILYGDFLYEAGNPTVITALLNTVFGLSSAITALIVNEIITTQYGVTGFIGAVLFCLGLTTSIFVEKWPQLVITMGVIQGAGMGLLFSVAYKRFSKYLKRNIKVANAITFASASTIVSVFPVTIEYWKDQHGLQGASTIISMLSFSVFGAVMLFQITQGSNSNPDKTQKEPPIKNFADRYNISMVEFTKPDEKIVISKTSSVLEYFYTPLLKNFGFLNVIFGLSFAIVVDLCFVNNIPLLLYGRGFARSEIAFIMSISTAGDGLSRIIQYGLNFLFTVKSRYRVLFGMTVITAVRFLIIFVDNSVVQYLVMSLGFFRSWLHGAATGALSDECDATNLQAAYRLMSVLTIIWYPVLGGLTLMESYIFASDRVTLGYFASLTGVISILWMIEMILRK